MRCDGTRRVLTERLAVVVRDLRRMPPAKPGVEVAEEPSAMCYYVERAQLREVPASTECTSGQLREV